MTRHPSFYVHGSAIVIAGILMMLAGCSKSLTSSTQDSSLVPGQTAAKPEPAKPEPTIQESEPSKRVEAKPEREPFAFPRGGETREEVRVPDLPPEPQAPAEPPPSQLQQAVGQPSAAAPGSANVGELGDVFFDYDKSTLRMDASPILDANARLLKAEGGWKLVISGHCDERGTSAYNLVLGERRARTVKKYLEDLGLPSSQIQVTSYGKEKPFCTEHNQECWQQNRRAHFTVQ